MNENEDPARPGKAEDKLNSGHQSLWEHFANHGDADKGRMINVVTWILGLGLAIAGYLAAYDLQYSDCICYKSSSGIKIFSWVGFIICAFASYMVWFFSDHADENFRKANVFANKLPYDIRKNIEMKPFQRWFLCKKLFGDLVGPIFPVYFVMSILLMLLFGGIGALIPVCAD